MRYKQLGRTGLRVSEICMGCMTFGGGPDAGIWGAIAGVDQDGVDALVRRALDAGVNFFDTADVYSFGQSERMLGTALRNLGVRRQDVVIATKALGPMGSGPNDAGASRGHIMDSIEGSLDRLGLDYIDLYQIHGFDPLTPAEETLRALDDLVRQGLVRYIGISNWPAWRIAKAIGIAERLGLHRFETVQSYYSIAGRDLEREIVPLVAEERLGLMVWSPLAGGFLSGKYSRENTAPNDGRRTNFDFPPVDLDRAWPILDALKEIAAKRGATVARVALAWLLAQPHVMSVIVGAKRLDQLDDNLAATGLQLDVDDLARLEPLSRLPAEYPGWMLERQGGYRR